jgi:hypothetical protein
MFHDISICFTISNYLFVDLAAVSDSVITTNKNEEICTITTRRTIFCDEDINTATAIENGQTKSPTGHKPDFCSNENEVSTESVCQPIEAAARRTIFCYEDINTATDSIEIGQKKSPIGLKTDFCNKEIKSICQPITVLARRTIFCDENINTATDSIQFIAKPKMPTPVISQKITVPSVARKTIYCNEDISTATASIEFITKPNNNKCKQLQMSDTGQKSMLTAADKTIYHEEDIENKSSIHISTENSQEQSMEVGKIIYRNENIEIESELYIPIENSPIKITDSRETIYSQEETMTETILIETETQTVRKSSNRLTIHCNESIEDTSSVVQTAPDSMCEPSNIEEFDQGELCMSLSMNTEEFKVNKNEPTTRRTIVFTEQIVVDANDMRPQNECSTNMGEFLYVLDDFCIFTHTFLKQIWLRIRSQLCKECVN